MNMQTEKDLREFFGERYRNYESMLILFDRLKLLRTDIEDVEEPWEDELLDILNYIEHNSDMLLMEVKGKRKEKELKRYL